MKKLFIVFLTTLTAIAMLLTSCGEPEITPCTEHTDGNNDLICDVCSEAITKGCEAHKDENADKLCDACGTEFFPRCSKHVDLNSNGRCDVCGSATLISVNVTLLDQEGTSISGVTVIFTDKNDEYNVVTFVTDSNGCAEVQLYAGEYRVTYDTLSEGTYFPEGYLPTPSDVVVSADTDYLEIEILKTVPNGEASRPFPISASTLEITLPASTLYHYIIYHSASLKVTFIGNDFRVVYGDNEYTPDNDGKVAFAFLESDANDNATLTIENLSDNENTLSVSVYSDPGTYGNPFIIEGNKSGATANVSNGGVYYKWTAPMAGSVTFSAENILIFKTENMASAMPLIKTEGNTDTHLGVYTLTVGGITYTVEIGDGDIVITDNAEGDASVSGSYTYTILDDGSFKVTDGSMPMPILLSKGGRTVVITSLLSSKQTGLSGEADSVTLTVKQDEELLVFVNSEYSDEVSFSFDLV